MQGSRAVKPQINVIFAQGARRGMAGRGGFLAWI